MAYNAGIPYGRAGSHPIQAPAHTPGQAAEDGPLFVLHYPCGRPQLSFWLLPGPSSIFAAI